MLRVGMQAYVGKLGCWLREKIHDLPPIMPEPACQIEPELVHLVVIADINEDDVFILHNHFQNNTMAHVNRYRR